METLKLMEEPDIYSVARRRMVQEQLLARGILDARVLDVMGRVKRHLFVDAGIRDQAYGDYPLGIGEGQTISQPYIVALMTETLGLKGGEKVLEIGSGCGYQTAVLAELAGQVYTIERVKSLGFLARRNLKSLNYRNIVIRIGDGSQGWPEAAPFDSILIAAGGPKIPEPLFNQLAEGGRMIVPVGEEDYQILTRVTRHGREMITENLGECRFVKLVGAHGWGKKRQAGDRFVKRSLV